MTNYCDHDYEGTYARPAQHVWSNRIRKHLSHGHGLRVLLLQLEVQEDKTHINPSDPEARLIAEAIGALYGNNAKRENEAMG